MLNLPELPPHIIFCIFLITLKLQIAIKYQGPKIWNSPDLEIEKSKSLKTLNFRLKYLLQKSCLN